MNPPVGPEEEGGWGFKVWAGERPAAAAIKSPSASETRFQQFYSNKPLQKVKLSVDPKQTVVIVVALDMGR